MTDLLQAKLKWFNQIKEDSMQETSMYLDYIADPARASVGNFIHAISDPFSYVGSLSLFNTETISYYENSLLLKELLISSSTGNKFPLKFVQIIDPI